MQSSFNPDRFSSCWIRIDHDSLMSNIVQVAQTAAIIDLELPMLRQLWPYIEEDILRAGIQGLICSDAETLLGADPALERILKPGSRQSDKGYARAGIVPVMSSVSECLALSNLAQSLDQRLPFLIHVRSSDSDSPSGDWNLESICEKVPSLPMIDLAGFYLRFTPPARLLGYFRRLLHNAEAVAQRIICPLPPGVEVLEGVTSYSLWENLAIGTDTANCFPVEIGCWAYPVRTGSDFQIFQADIGRLHGLPEKFPVIVGGEAAEIEKISDDFCEFVIRRPLAGPFPEKALMTGGSAFAAVEMSEWRPEDLRNLLLHLSGCPVYLQQKTRTIEIMP
ncbi:MAG: hypothetical protein CVV42_08065 [Candidatus Riflebacteria bacterium HGW-Riflebacteria-2]|jgi:hypothetical protein|nr:MAG: hypothetical protein CVV42_08065 [Candidatus Riflebacteria bacterium HGW-Riflebacteria-2]